MEWAETEIRISYFTLPTIDANTIRGTIIYIDSFGNAIINITKEIFEKEHKGRSFNAPIRPAIHGFFFPDAVVFHDFPFGIAEERKRQRKLAFKFPMRLDGVGADS